MHEKINKGADFGLRKAARRIDRIDALGIDGQIRDRLFYKAFGQRIRI